MKSFLIACVVAVVLAIGAALVLSAVQMPAGEAFISPSSVRI
jgi:hypothetical protein